MIKNCLSSLSLFLLFIKICFSSSPEFKQIDPYSISQYQIEWISTTISDKGFDFHKNNALRLARNKAILDLSRPLNTSNFAIIGLSIHNSKIPDRTLFSTFPNIVSSTYNTLEDTPTLDEQGVSFMSISDMMRADIAEGKTRVHRISDFLKYLFFNSYTKNWELYDGIKECLRVISGNNPIQMAKIPSHSSISSVLHSEQVFLYRALTSDGIFNFLLSDLLTQKESVNLLKDPDSYLTIDIMTYNDMCPKCFSTCNYMIDRLSTTINRILSQQLQLLGKFMEIFDNRRGKSFDINIVVSSFKPYRTSRQSQEAEYTYYKTANFVNPMKERDESNRIIQFFNPWVAQHIFNYEVENFISSMQRLGTARFYDEWNLPRKFSKLIETKQIEIPIINEISTKLLAQKDAFDRSDVCRYLLPFSIELAKQITEHKDEFHTFIRDMAIKSNVNDKSLAQLIGHLKTILEQTDSIRLAINDQQMKLNTLLLLESSKKSGGYYNFNKMIDAAKKISLKDLHPTIDRFIRTELGKLLNIPSQENWRTLPLGYIQLQGILQGILQ